MTPFSLNSVVAVTHGRPGSQWTASSKGEGIWACPATRSWVDHSCHPKRRPGTASTNPKTFASFFPCTLPSSTGTVTGAWPRHFLPARVTLPPSLGHHGAAQQPRPQLLHIPLLGAVSAWEEAWWSLRYYFSLSVLIFWLDCQRASGGLWLFHYICVCDNEGLSPKSQTSTMVLSSVSQVTAALFFPK